MNRAIDCLIIGTYQADFEDEERRLRLFGTNYAAYREMSTAFIQYENRFYTAQDIYNRLITECITPQNSSEHFTFGKVFSPTIAYLGTYLHRNGCTFDFINWFQDEKDILIKILKEENILTIGVTTTLYPIVFPIIEVVAFIRKYNKSAKIVVGGPFVNKSYLQQEKASLNKQFDLIDADFYIINHQGETALVNLIRSLKGGQPVGKIKNIAYKNNNTYIYNDIEPEANKLEENMVEWELFAGREKSYVAIRTGISCPFSCNFCLYPKLGGEYQYIGVDVIEKELNALEKTGKVKCLYFSDDTFNIPVNRFKEILRMIIRNKYSFRWHSYFRCQYADEEMVELMKESGCEGVMLGIESGSQKILNNMNKAVTIEQYRRGIRLLNEYGIPALTSYMVGFPGETKDTVCETINFIEEMKAPFYQAFVWYASPGSPIWGKKEEYGLNGQDYNWSHNTMNVQTACDMAEYMFHNIKCSTWVPKHNFHSDGLFFMKHNGMDFEQIREFFNAFNDGVRAKLQNPQNMEVSRDVIERMRNSILAGNYTKNK